MIKTIFTALVMLLMMGTVSASDALKSQTFIGFEIAGTDLDSNASAGTNISYGIRVGAQNDEWRTTLLYNHYNSSASGIEETINQGSFNLDYFMWTTETNSLHIKPFVGMHVGYMNYEWLENGLAIDESDLFFGGQVGVSLEVIDVVEIDLGYKYSKTNIDNLNNIGSFFLGLNYFY
ncbi:MAG: hypothetical protein COA92_02700 [Sulfurovum sp.]|nr:MAG: hypothetical protein COA92_02700 [Sulfurovum sp.]